MIRKEELFKEIQDYCDNTIGGSFVHEDQVANDIIKMVDKFIGKLADELLAIIQNPEKK